MDQSDMTEYFDATTVKPVRVGRYQYAMKLDDGKRYLAARDFDGERWLGITGKPFYVMPGDLWRGLTRAARVALLNELK